MRHSRTGKPYCDTRTIPERSARIPAAPPSIGQNSAGWPIGRPRVLPARARHSPVGGLLVELGRLRVSASQTKGSGARGGKAEGRGAAPSVASDGGISYNIWREARLATEHAGKHLHPVRRASPSQLQAMQGKT